MLPLFEMARRLPLTAMEQDVLTYMETHLPASAYMKLDDVSHAVYTSNATIVRFCQKLGLSGYHAFKYELRKQLTQAGAQTASNHNLMDVSMATYRDQLDAFDVEKLEIMSRYIASQRPLYIYGSELSALAAKYLQMILTTLDRSCILIEWRNLLERISSSVEEDAILFIISAHGDAKRYHSVFQNAKQRQATVLFLTCNETSPLLSTSTIALCTHDELIQYHHVDINARLGILTAVQLIIEIYAQSTLP